jgi:alpha-methylacyl-CoA racemase
MPGALDGIRIIEIAGIGPAPFAGMMLADHGAQVIRVERPGGTRGGVTIRPEADVLGRSRETVEIDLKSPAGVSALRDLIASADGLIEGFRPGVMERLGLGPDALLGLNPRLVYGRMTGWGQTGPYAQTAGHDINYIALAGVLHGLGRAGGPPTPPINLLGDFGGGGMLLAFGMLAGILSARATGIGQVVDCAMAEGASLLMAMIWGLRGQGDWTDERGTNELDTGAPYYDVYATADDRYVAIGPVEPQFWQDLLRRIGAEDDPDLREGQDPARWPAARAALAARIRTRTRDAWCTLLEGTDCCFAPVLNMAEAPAHPHNRARGAFVDMLGVVQPAPAPRFSQTPAIPPAPSRPLADRS